MRRLSISLALTATVATTALPANAMFLQVDPVGYADQMNLYAYVHNDPLNKVDPTGMYTFCTVATNGTGSESCVHADVDGDGNAFNKGDGDSLSQYQLTQISNDFHPFIIQNDGLDISGSGLPTDTHFIDRMTASDNDVAMARTVSQFVGAAQGGWGKNVNLAVSNRGYPTDAGRTDITGAGGYEIVQFARYYTNSGGSFVNNPSDIARTLIHENIAHVATGARPMATGSPEHLAYDAQARGLLRHYGLGAGGCARIGPYPGC